MRWLCLGRVARLRLRETLAVLICSAAVAASTEDVVDGETEEATPEGVAIAGTLLGAVLFQMTLFYLTNHPDDDMRRYSYQIINATISIFSAVLFFQTINEVVHQLLLEDQSAETVILVNMGHMLFWFLALQMSLAWISGAICAAPRSMEVMELNMKSVAQLLAHVTGFASINAWGSLQQHPVFSASPLKTLAVIPISFCCLVTFQWFSGVCRNFIALEDDGKKDDMEKMWDEQTRESEIDVIGLTLSFNACQAIRFSITGCLPTPEGKEPPDVLFNHPPDDVAKLAATGLGFASFMLLMHLKICRNANAHGTVEVSGTSRGAVCWRLRSVCLCIFAMAFAWCMFFSARMFLASFPGLKDPMISSVVLTLGISFASFSCISALDWLADGSVHGKRVPAVKQVIDAFAILVGFAWEQCFDQAVESLSSSLPQPQLYKPTLAMCSIVVILPAWRWYLLPMVLREGWDFGFVFSSHKAHKKAKIARHILTHMAAQGSELALELDKIAEELGYVKMQLNPQATVGATPQVGYKPLPVRAQSQPPASYTPHAAATAQQGTAIAVAQYGYSTPSRSRRKTVPSAFSAAAPSSPTAADTSHCAPRVGEESGIPRPFAMNHESADRFACRVQELEGLTQSLLGSLHRGRQHEAYSGHDRL